MKMCKCCGVVFIRREGIVAVCRDSLWPTVETYVEYLLTLQRNENESDHHYELIEHLASLLLQQLVEDITN